MRSEWREVKLEELCKINRENYKQSDRWKYVNYLDTGNITKGVIDQITYFDLEKEKLPSRARRKVSVNDIVYSTVRPNQEHYGIIRNPASNMLVSTGFVTITPQEDVFPDYLYYYLSQSQLTAYLHAIAEQRVSTYPALNVSDLANLDILLPALSSQKAIAATLSCLDAKIELNNRINENLEQQAQAIFRSWFVNFEPFQNDEFVESELGLIPEGWEVGVLGDLMEVFSGKRPGERQTTPSGEMSVPILGASKIMGYTNQILFEEPILVTGRVGTHGVIQKFYSRCWPSDNTLVMKTPYYEFIYQNLKKIDFTSLNRGSTQPLITQSDLKDQIVVIPRGHVLNQFEELMSVFSNLNRLSLSQSETLVALRDTLLPKLMSGEIEVPVET